MAVHQVRTMIKDLAEQSGDDAMTRKALQSAPLSDIEHLNWLSSQIVRGRVHIVGGSDTQPVSATMLKFHRGHVFIINDVPPITVDEAVEETRIFNETNTANY